MKWVFAFNQYYLIKNADLIRVAVESAFQNTSLSPVALYDGEECAMTEWLRAKGVEVVPCRTVFYDLLGEYARKRADPAILEIGSGAFLRLEIPRLAREQGWADEFVLYTDCDVMFLQDPEPILSPLRPRYFAAAPDFRPEKNLHMNSGVTWINIAGLGEEIARLQYFTGQHFEAVVKNSWDQGALRAYFNPVHRAAYRLRIPDRLFYYVMTRLPLKTWQWEDLPLTMNWKPYSEKSEEAVIVHFHMHKPNAPEHWDVMERESKPGFRVSTFHFYAGLWTRYRDSLATENG